MQQAVPARRESPVWRLKEAARPKPGYVEIAIQAEKRVSAATPKVSQSLTDPVPGDGTDSKQVDGSNREESSHGDRPRSQTPVQLPDVGEHEEQAEYSLSYPSSLAGTSNPSSPVCAPQIACANDEAHYITTHEIQLCEADQEPDYPDFGLAPSSAWSQAVDSAPCAFLEYASFDSQGGSPTDEDYYMSTTTSDPNPTDSVCSAELISSSSQSDSDTSPSICSSTLDNKALNTGEAARSKAGILLSIRSASNTINEGGNVQGQTNTAPAGAKHDTDMSYCVSSAPDCKSAFRQLHHQFPALPQAADAHRFVAVPARLQARSGVHADISSGASSAVSELDDADKEVRNLTARAFRSLAYPYFEAINFSSSESTTSLSDQNIGINSWSTYLDFKGGAVLSQKAEKSIHQHSATSASSFGLSKFNKNAPKEQVFVQANKSHTKAFELVLSELETKGASGGSGSSQRIQSGSRVVTLTETLNFSSNVTTTASGSDRANKPPEQAPASAQADGVTESLPREPAEQEGSRQSHSAAAETMDGTHKSKFASSLLKNVISKKMQLEQEFKMERGEITDTSYKGVCTPSKETEGAREKGIQRQNSRFSEASSDFTLVSSEELGEFFDSKSVTPKDLTPAEGNVAKQLSSIDHQREEESKKSASEAMKGMLLRSQNSAFRSWKEKEIEKMEKKIEEKVAKARRIKIPLERDWRADLGELPGSQSTKMSRLYVPGIQHTPKQNQAEKQATKYSVSTYAHQSCFSRNEHDFKTEKLEVLEAAVCRMTPMLTPKPQEIKLNLPLSGDNKENPFSIAKLLTPNLASTAANLSKAAEELKSQVAPCRTEVLEKMPQFLVRDVRENKPKSQGAIHQVRDVRKLLKSSYHHDTGEGNDKGNGMSGHSTPDPKAKLSVASKVSSSLSPIVITCQAMNNKENGEDSADTREGDKALSSADTILVHRASGRLPVATIAPNKTGPRMPVVKIVSKASKWKQEKPREQPEVKVEPQTPKSRAAIDKLTAAVKTMEQLYVFDKKEWKRKDQPEPLTGSHVLSLLSCEEPEVKSESQTVDDKPVAPEETKKAVPRPFGRAPEPLVRRNSYPSSGKSPSKPPAAETKAPIKTFQVSKIGEPKSVEQQKSPDTGIAGNNRSVFTVSAAKRQQSLESALNSRNARPQPPTSLRIQPRSLQEAWKKAEPEPTVAPQPPQPRKASTDFENYLTIPVKAASEAAVGKPPVAAIVRDTSTSSRENAATHSRDPASMCSLPPFSAKSHPASPKSPMKTVSDWRSKVKEGVQPNRTHSTGVEPQSPDSIPLATIYHHAIPPVPVAMPSSQAPVFYSPPLPAATPVEIYPQQTQRKMLVDLATGQYYLVDTPVQPVKKRLFDPETGQYVEVPVPAPPATPVPVHMPPLALSPGAYGAAYMFYPGFLPTATTAMLPATPLQSQFSHQGSEHSFEVLGVETAQSGELNMNECPYYLATGSAAANAVTGQAANIRRGSLGCPESKQVISILSQPGPRIVAPPSFDGTTMRFVVEHR
ncbi:uncharacterized protein C4orf54 [Xenopus laevis]|uniref:Uncharacterized protein C4orf54 n=2 Tax=Xenopus laevis TaxID=8355 RepID=A0A1L8HV53_XENLA|nr:uncharacterized protein C4orf54 [Xenopus laevis]OCT99953.1 hypothetical protein XELAEV_18005737mg [Xenopus laevis]